MWCRVAVLLMALAVGLMGQPSAVKAKVLRLDGYPDWAWDESRSRMFVSAGSAILMIEPETLEIEDRLFTGGLVEAIAISADGQFLYAGVGERAVIERYDLRSRLKDLEIPLKSVSGAGLAAIAMTVVPGDPRSVVVARSTWPLNATFPTPVYDLALYEEASQRGPAVAGKIGSFHVAPDGSLHGVGSAGLQRFAISTEGILVSRVTPLAPAGPFRGTSNGRYLVDSQGVAYDLEAGEPLGKVADASLGAQVAALGPDAQRASVLMAEVAGIGPGAGLQVHRYALDSFRRTASGAVDGASGRISIGSVAGRAWGTDGLLLRAYVDSQGWQLYSLHTTGLPPIDDGTPAPIADGSGAVRIAIPANDLVFDASRNLVWATVPGTVPGVGNCAVGINPETGTVVQRIQAGSEPADAALSADGSRLFTVSASVPVVSILDLEAQQRVSRFAVTDADYWMPRSLVAVPDRPDSVAVLRSHAGETYRIDIRVYDGGTPRAHSFSNVRPDAKDLLTEHFTSLDPGETPETLYASDTELEFGNGTRRVARVAVNADGIGRVQALRPLNLGSISAGGGLVYDNGRLFTGAGDIRSPDTERLEGRLHIEPDYAGAGVPIPFPDRNQVVYATTPGLREAGAITVFDLDTLLPLATMRLPKARLLRPPPIRAVRAGTDRIAVAWDGDILLIPLKALQPWSQPVTGLRRAGSGLTRVDLRANAIAALPGTTKIVVSTSSSQGTLGNSLLTLDPSTGRIESSVYAGSEPDLLAPTADGSAVWVNLRGQGRIARVDLAARTRDRLFIADPGGGSNQYDIYDLGMAPDGGLTVSYTGGPIAMFDDMTLRPDVDWNDQAGASAAIPATFRFAFSSEGSTLYAFNGFLSSFEFKRLSVGARGLRWLSTTEELVSGYGNALWTANGLLYTADGYVVDPELSRRIGRFAFPDSRFQPAGAALAPDAERVYFLGRSLFHTEWVIGAFDLRTHAFLGSLPLDIANGDTTTGASLVRFSDDGIAINTGKAIFFVQLSAIPLASAPVPSPPLPPLPETPGTFTVDLAASALAYDAVHDLLYATVPNREAARGDRIAAIDPATGTVLRLYPAGLNPRRLAVAPDGNRIYFAAGWMPNRLLWSFSLVSEEVRRLDLATSAVSEPFGVLPPAGDSSYSIADLAALSGEDESVVAIHARETLLFAANGPIMILDPALESVKVYDGGVSRTSLVNGSPSLNCLRLQAGVSARRLYCTSSTGFTKLAVDASGIQTDGPSTSLPGDGYNQTAFYGGRLFTTAGLAVEAESGPGWVQAPASGWVAAGDGRVYWLDFGYVFAAPAEVTLRSFDATTLEPLDSKKIAITRGDTSELTWCGKGRVAFRAGHEIYIVQMAQGR